MEYHLHGLEQQAGAAFGVAIEECVACGHNDHAGHDCNEGIHDDDDDCVLLDLFLLAQVRAVGDYSAHAERQREEHLTCRSLENGEEVSLERLNVEAEHELVAAHCAGLNSDINDNNEEDNEQAGHTDVAELLDTAADACRNDDCVDNDEYKSPDNHRGAVGSKDAEVGGNVGNTPGVNAEHSKQVAACITHDHAAEKHVEAEDQERAGKRHVAEEGELLAELAVCCDGAQAGLTTDDELADHDCNADEDCENEIDEKECEAAIHTHFVREAPNIAQTDCGTDSSHDKAKIGSKSLTICFFHCFLSFCDLNTFTRDATEATRCMLISNQQATKFINRLYTIFTLFSILLSCLNINFRFTSIKFYALLTTLTLFIWVL